MTLQTVKLSQLRLSPLNVRRVKPKAIDQLAADMLAHGQLQNLVVYAEGNRFEVAAGGRRYRAFKQLEKAKAIPPSHPVSVDVRDKGEAVELSLAENVAREDMHVADAVIAYGDLREQGKSPEDIAARFGVALSYVRKVLRLSALHPDALACLARDQIGMEAAQALTLTDDHDRQHEALKRFGNSAHQIRRMMTETKIGTASALFLFVGHDAYAAAGGTITADLFAEGGDGYADDSELVETLATAKLSEIADGYRADGWQEVRASLERPDDYFNLVTVHAEGRREPTEAEQAERARIQAAADARAAELGKGNQWGDRVFNGLEREARILENRLCVFTDAQKADSAMVLFVGNGGEVEAKAIRTKRIARGDSGDAPAIKPDYSGAMIETLSKIKTLAVQEAVATNPALALDILLDCLVGQGIHREPSYYSPLSLRLEGFNAGVPDDMMTMADIASVDAIGGSDFAAMPEAARVPIIPVVAQGGSVSVSIPAELRATNAFFQDPADVRLDTLAALALEALGLLRRQRRVFISYRRDDSRDAALQLHDELSGRGFDVFLDTHDILPGDPFQEMLWHRLADCDVVIMLDTKDYFASKWTKQEIGRSLAQGIHILRVIWPGHTPSRHLTLSDALQLGATDMGPGGRLTTARISEIVARTERLRSRSVATRHREIAGRLRIEVERIGGTFEGIGAHRAMGLTLPNGLEVQAYPVVGVPTAELLNDVHEKALSAGHGRRPSLVYDHHGIRPAWLSHLKWLDEQVADVRALRVFDAAWELAAWDS